MMKGALNKAWNFLGSRDFSAFIFIMALTYFLFLVIFSAAIPGWWVNNISKLLPFKVLYLLFFLNLVICEIKWIPVVVRRCRKPAAAETEEEYDRFRHQIVLSDQGTAVDGLEKYLRRRGYKVQTGDARLKTEQSGLKSRVVLHAYKGRFSPIGNLLFHVSFLFLLAGVFVSIFYRSEAKVLLMEGQESVSSGLNVPYFEVVDIDARFWKEKLLFTELVARLKHEGGEDEARLSSPAHVGGANITIGGISYTPKYILKEKDGRELDVGYVNLANFVPGSTDNFQIPGFPYKIYVSIYPDFEIGKSASWTKSLNLRNPRCLVRVVRGKVTVFSGLLGVQDEASFDGLALSFPEIRYNGTFRIITDPGNVFVWVGLVLMGVGLVWKLVFYKREVAVFVAMEEMHLYISSDYYHNLFMEKCLRLIKS